MLQGIATLPLESLDAFTSDPRMVAAAESYLRRALEALLDLGRHLLAKGFGQPVAEYANIADALGKANVLSTEQAATLRQMAKYRNRMVHFYDEITREELYQILTKRLEDFDELLGAIDRWLASHPEKVRSEL